MVMTLVKMDRFYGVLNVLMLTSRYIYRQQLKHSAFLCLNLRAMFTVFRKWKRALNCLQQFSVMGCE